MSLSSRQALVSLSFGAALLAACDPTTSPDTGSTPAPKQGFSSAFPFNAKVTYGSMTDARDGQAYATVKIGTQTWMAENLAWDTADGKGSYCWENKADSCRIYGRFYDIRTAMAGRPSSEAVPSGVRGVCPVGWHLPSRGEWKILLHSVGDTATSAHSLRATTTWTNPVDGALDSVGFRALGTGYYEGFLGVFEDDHFQNRGERARWWASAKDSYGYGYALGLQSDTAAVMLESWLWPDGYSVRCLAD